MILFSREDCKTAVNGFGQNDAHQLVRKGEAGKRDAFVASRFDARRQSVRRADDKGEFAAFVNAAGKERGELAAK